MRFGPFYHIHSQREKAFTIDATQKKDHGSNRIEAVSTTWYLSICERHILVHHTLHPKKEGRKKTVLSKGLTGRSSFLFVLHIPSFNLLRYQLYLHSKQFKLFSILFNNEMK